MKDDTISRAAAIDAIDVIPWYHQNKNGEMVHGANSDEHQAWYKADDIYKAIESVPSAQPTCTENVPVDDCISRQAAIDALNVLCQEHRYRIPGKRETYSQYNEAWQDALGRAEGAIGNLPSAQPDVPDTNVGDMISRQAAIKALEETKQSDPFNRYEDQNIGIDWSIDAIKALPPAQPGEDIRAMCGECDAWNQYKNYPQPQWIPCSERLPEEDTEVLISYRYKEGEGDTDHVNIDITSYGTTCFGGREIHTLKEWRQPFDYFHANYEVIAWMPLPTPYREGGQDGKN